MKKYLLIFFVIACVLLGFSSKSASADYYDGFSGCTSAGPYNTLTGQLCVNPTNVVGCQPGYMYSPVTGQTCNISNYPVGCTSTFGYSTVTGQPCSFSSNLPAGCSSSQGFSITTGQPCGSTYYTQPPIYPPYPPGCYSTYGYSTIDGQSCLTYSNTQRPTISGVSGPQSLNVNQQGTWRVTAYSPSGGNLSYSVYWGDEPYSLYANSYPTTTLSQQSASFTHTYSRAGNYTPTFTVTSDNTIRCFTTPCPVNGGSAQTSLSVNVFGGTTTQFPNISYLSPASGAIGTQVYIYGSGLSGATINFGGYPVSASTVSDSQIRFVVPSNLSNCTYNMVCTQVYLPVNPGFSYPVSVSNTRGTSNAINFQVAYY